MKSAAPTAEDFDYSPFSPRERHAQALFACKALIYKGGRSDKTIAAILNKSPFDYDDRPWTAADVKTIRRPMRR